MMIVINILLRSLTLVQLLSKRFVKQLSELVKCKFGVEICAIYTTYKVGCCFQLKSATPNTLSSNVIYQFLCSGDTTLSYVA